MISSSGPKRSRACPSIGITWSNSSPTLAALKAESEKRGWTYHEEIYRPTPRIALNGDFDAYLSGIEKKQRHEIRRKMRRAAESDLPVHFYIVEDAATLESEMEAFFQLMAQDSNKAGFLKPAMREHMSALMRSAFEQGYLWLAFLTIDGVKAAACLNFDYKNKLWGYNSGVSQRFHGTFARLGLARLINCSGPASTGVMNLTSCAAMKNISIALAASTSM